MGKGYGSEWNLARYLGHRCGELDAAVARGAGGRLIRWLDARGPPDGETHQGMGI